MTSIFQSTPSAWRETRRSVRVATEHSTFQSTPSAWRETTTGTLTRWRCLNFNPLPPHGGRQHFSHSTPIAIFISIHSLRMEGDERTFQCGTITKYFNPLPPHGGRLQLLFVSMLLHQHFNPLPPHGGRLYFYNHFICSFQFQSTPSAWRETTLTIMYFVSKMEFQSTPSAWRETQNVNHEV